MGLCTVCFSYAQRVFFSLLWGLGDHRSPAPKTPQDGCTDILVKSATHGWLGQWGASNNCFLLSSIILLSTRGMRGTGGEAKRHMFGHGGKQVHSSPVNMQPHSNLWCQIHFHFLFVPLNMCQYVVPHLAVYLALSDTAFLVSPNVVSQCGVG